MTYTYKATTAPGQGFTLDDAKLVEGFCGVVQRSDGVEVWRGALYVGSGASDKRAAQLQANREVPKWRYYLQHHGRCFHDDKKAKRETVRAYKAARKTAYEPVSQALGAGMTAAATGLEADACPHQGDDKLALRLAWCAGWNAGRSAGLVKPEDA